MPEQSSQTVVKEGPAFVFSPTPQPIQLPQTVATSGSDVSTALVPIMTDPVQREQLVFSRHLSPADKVKARQAAMKLYQASLQDSNAIVTFGDRSLRPLNELVEYQLTQVEPVSLPGLRKELELFQRQMAAIKGRYDLEDPKVRSDYNKWASGVKGFLARVKDFGAMFKADILSIEKQIDQIEAMLAGAQIETYKNVAIYDQVFQKNEEGIQALMFDIAVMELYVDYVGQLRPPTKKPDGSVMTDRDVDMWKQDQAQRIMIVRTKIANTKGRLSIAWTTSPQARMSQMTDICLQAQLHNLQHQGVPLARQLLLSMRQAMVSLQNAQSGQAVAQLINSMARQNAELHEQSVTAVMTMASQPIFMPETITYVTAMLDKAAEGVLAGYRAGEVKHAQIDQALAEQQQHLSSSTQEISGEAMQRLVTQAVEPLPEALTTVQMVALPTR